MRRIMILLLVSWLFFPAVCLADKIQGHACYSYGDSESLVQAEQIAKALAIRNAIESYTVFIESTTQITDFQLTQDLLKTVSVGQVKGVKVLKRLESGRTLCYTVEGFVNPQEMQTAVKDYLAGKSPDAQLQDNGRIKILGMGVRKEENFRFLIIEIQFLKYAKAIQIEEEPIIKGTIVYNIFKEVERTTGEKIITETYVKKFAPDYRFKVMVTFFDENGFAIKEAGDYIRAGDKSEVVPGEKDYVLFSIPENAQTWKAWVPK